MLPTQRHLYRIIGERIKFHRLEQGWALGILALYFDIHIMTLVNIEKGRYPITKDILQALADAFECPLSDLASQEELGLLWTKSRKGVRFGLHTWKTQKETSIS